MDEDRHDWNISDITWDRNEMRAEMRGERSPEQSAGASSAQQVLFCGHDARLQLKRPFHLMYNEHRTGEIGIGTCAVNV